MKKIIIPKKTFDMYKNGHRTFIHILKNAEVEHLKHLQFGEDVLLVNKETDEKMQQTFWHFF